MNVQLPDGTVVENVPEGTTKAQLMEKLRAGGYDTSSLTSAPEPEAATESAEQAPHQYHLSEVPLEAAKHLPESAAEAFTGVVSAIANPGATFRAIGDAVQGANINVLKKLDSMFGAGMTVKPGKEAEVARMTATANALGGMYVDRYGSYDNIKRTMAEDPVGFAMDASMLLGGASGVAKAAGAPGTARALGALSKVSDPMRAVTAPVGWGLKQTGGIGKHFQNVLNPMPNAIREATGNADERIIRALRQKQKYPGITAGEIAAREGNVGLPGLQAEVSGISPSIVQAYETTGQARDAARIRDLLGVAKTPEKLDALKAVREAEATEKYGRVWENLTGAANIDNTVQLIDDFIAREPLNRKLVNALNDIQRNLHDLSGGEAVPRAMPNELMSAADDIEGLIRTQGNEHIQGQLLRVKQQLIKDIPGGEEAVNAFRLASQPINRVEVGQHLLNRLTGGERMATGVPVSGQLKRGATLSSMSDEGALIKTATGREYSPDLDRLFKGDPKGLATLRRLQADLQSESNFLKAVTKGRKGGVKVGAEKGRTIPILDRVATVANFMFQRLQGKVDRTTSIRLATDFLKPEKAAKTIQDALRIEAHRAARSKSYLGAGKQLESAARSSALKAGASANRSLDDLEGQYGVSAADILRQHYGKDAKSEKLLKSMANDYGVADSEEDSVLNPPRRLSSEGVPDSLQVQPPRVQVFSADDTEYDRLLRDARAKSQNLHK